MAIGFWSTGQASPVDGCSSVPEGSITESQRFTPYEARRSKLPYSEAILAQGQKGETALASIAVVRSAALDGLARQHTVGTADAVYQYYLDRPIGGLSRAAFMKAGGIELAQESQAGNVDFAASLFTMGFGDRVTHVQVGPYSGALTWGDPDEGGTRTHNVYWADGVNNYSISADRSAAVVLSLARSLACA
jgi:hypothetical protein